MNKDPKLYKNLRDEEYICKADMYAGLENMTLQGVSSELLRAGRSLSEKDMHGNTALHIATVLGHREAIAMLQKMMSSKFRTEDAWIIGQRMAARLVHEAFPLHKAAFFNDTHSIVQLLRAGQSLSEKDMHGNTALHIATMLGHREAIAMLLANNAPVRIKNIDGWNPLMESVSYGDRQIITEMLRKLETQTSEKMTRGNLLRMDTTLADFSERNWERGDITFLFNVDASPGEQLVVMDNKTKVFQSGRLEESEAEIDEEVDVLMSTDIVNAHMSTKTVGFKQAYSGWVFKHAREEQMGDFPVNFYSVEGLKLTTRKRREHLSSDDVKKNKSILHSLTSGHTVQDDEFASLQHRKSLPPPDRLPTTWEEYSGAAPRAPPQMGRPQIVKTNEKQFKALAGMSEEFPLSVDVLVDLLEVVAPFKHLDKLRRFCSARLPPGFPVCVEIEMLRKLKTQTNEKMTRGKPHLLKMFQDLGDFYMEFKWDFQSWIPLLSVAMMNDWSYSGKIRTCSGGVSSESTSSKPTTSSSSSSSSSSHHNPSSTACQQPTSSSSGGGGDDDEEDKDKKIPRFFKPQEDAPEEPKEEEDDVGALAGSVDACRVKPWEKGKTPPPEGPEGAKKVSRDNMEASRKRTQPHGEDDGTGNVVYDCLMGQASKRGNYRGGDGGGAGGSAAV